MNSFICARCGATKKSYAQLQRHLKDTHSKRFTCPSCQKSSATSRTMYRMRRHLERVHRVDPNVYFPFKRHAHNNKDVTASRSCPIPSLLSLNVRLPPQTNAPTATISKAPMDGTKNEPLKTVTEPEEASKQVTTLVQTSPSHEPHNEKSNSDEDTLTDSDSVSPPPTPKGLETSSDEFKSPKVNISIEKNQVVFSTGAKTQEKPKASRPEFVVLPLPPTVQREREPTSSQTSQLASSRGLTKLIPVSPVKHFSSEDPRQFALYAPSTCNTEFPICALKRAHSEARRQPSSKRSTKLLTGQYYSTKQVKEALLPDGTV